MKTQKKYLIMAMAVAFVASALQAADEMQATTELQFSDPVNLSKSTIPDLGIAFKTKLVRLGNGMLISTYGDGVDPDKIVYDVKGQVERPARDVFVRTCPSVALDCTVETNWSTPKNISNTASKSSMTADWQGDLGEPSPYWGDSDKPNIANGGANLMLTWVDKYCLALPDDTDNETNQRSVSYLTRDNREVPFSCIWASYSSNGGLAWSVPQQLSDASRDAKGDSSKVNSVGKSIISWQEDPLGLALGQSEGPGDGASGATASHGTDVWYAVTSNEVTDAELNKGKPTGFTSIMRLTDNGTENKASGNHGVIRDVFGNEIIDDNIEGGQAAATRPNTGLVGPKVVIAYEETKGSEGLVIGKFVRYHSFNYPNIADTTTFPTIEPGCIISNPLENARRVRFVPQATPGAESGIQMGIFWKEGQYDQGGPSDIMVRIASNGVEPANMSPAVDPDCATSDYLLAEDLENSPAMNISSNAPIATAANLSDTTETNNLENALAHRGAIVGDDLYIGYSYTNDWALATYTNLVNYDFWLRHYDGVTGTWTNPKNLSNLPTKLLNVREPRFVKTPFSSVETDYYNPNAFVIAWGLQTNVASHIEDAEDLDIMYTRSFDKGVTMEPVVRVANPDGNARYESQLRLSPSGDTVYAAWNEEFSTGTDAMFAVASNGPVTGSDPYEGLYDVVSDDAADVVSEDATEDVTSISKTSSGGGVGVFYALILALLTAIRIGSVGLSGRGSARK